MPTARHIYATAGEELLKYDSADLSSYVWLVYNSYISGGEEAPVTANDAGTSWLPDQEGHTIMEVTADGTADYEVESVDFEPTAVAADESGNYYVGGVDGHLTKFDEYGKAWASNVSDYEIKALMWHDGRLYASSAIGLTSPESDGGFHYDVDDYMEPMVMASGGGYVYFGGYNSYYEEHELMQFEASALSYNSLDDAGENWRKTFIDSNEFVGLAADSRGVYVSLRYDDLIFFDTDGTQQASRNSLEYTPVHGLGGGDSYTYTSNQAPTAAFAYSKSGGTVDFTDQSSDGDGTVQSYSWDFGDGTTSTQQSPSHTYASSGTYTVSLTVTDDAGATATATQDISVTAVIGGTAALADNGPAPAASGATRNAGASAITEAADVLSLSGALPLSTELALSGKAQALGLQARAPAAGTAALVDTASSFTASSGTTLDQSPFLFHADSELTKAIKRDAKNGDKVWEYVPSAGGVQPLAADQNGNLYVGADDGALLTKVGAAGAKQWTWDGSPAYDDVFAIEILDSGNLAVKAYDGADYYLTEIDAASGTTERERKATHGGSAQNPRSIEAAPNGGLYWSGFTSPFIKRLDSSWNEVWTWTAPAGYEYGPYQLGATSSALYGIADGNVLRVDPTTANTVWVDTIGDRYAGELAVSDSDHIYAAYDASTEDDIVRYSDTGSALFGEWQVFAVEHPNLQADNRGNLFATFNVDPDGDQGTSTGDDDRLQQYAGEGGLEWQKTFYDDYIQEPELQPVPPRVEGAGAFSSRGELLSLVGTTLAAGEAQLASSRETTTIEGAPYVAGSGSSLDAKPALALAGNTSTAIAFDINDKPTAATAAGRANAAATAGLSAAKESLGADGDVSIQAQGAAQSGTADVGAGGGPLATSTLSLTGRAAQVLLVGGPVAGGAGSLAGKPQPIALLGGAAAGGSAGLRPAGEALAAAGTLATAGGVNATDNPQQVALIGTPVATAGAQLTGKGEALASAGAATASGSATPAGGGQQFAFGGNVLIAGAGSAANAGEVLALTGAVFGSGTGDLAFTDTSATLDMEGGALASGGGGFTGAAPALASEGVLPLRTALSLTDASTSQDVGAEVLASGALAAASKKETAAGLGAALASASGQVASTQEALALAGTPIAGGHLAAEDKGERVQLFGIPVLTTSLSVEDEAKAAEAEGQAKASGDLSAAGAPIVLAGQGGPIASAGGGLASAKEALALAGTPIASGGGGLASQPEALALAGAPIASASATLASSNEAATGSGRLLVSARFRLEDDGPVLLAADGRILAAGSGDLAGGGLEKITTAVFVGREPDTASFALSDRLQLGASITD